MSNVGWEVLKQPANTLAAADVDGDIKSGNQFGSTDNTDVYACSFTSRGLVMSFSLGCVQLTTLWM